MLARGAKGTGNGMLANGAKGTGIGMCAGWGIGRVEVEHGETDLEDGAEVARIGLAAPACSL
jgi:hypothetical protein